MTTLANLESALQHPNVKAFLRVIRAGESHAWNDEAYRALYGWRPGNGLVIDDFTNHPRIAYKSPWGYTSAAGAYQAMCAVPGKVKTDTWGDFVRFCNDDAIRTPDFSPHWQDVFAIWCIARRHALNAVFAGDVETAIHLCATEWASLPGSPYGQPTISIEKCLKVFQEALLRQQQEHPSDSTPTIVTEDHPAQEGIMPLPAVVLALLPQLLSSLPSLAKIVSRSEGESVTERNVKLAEKVGEIVTQATGQDTIEGAVKAIQQDPQVQQRADAAIAASFAEIMDLLKFEEASRGAARDFAERMTSVETPNARMWRALGFGCLLTVLALTVVGGGGWILYSVLISAETPAEQKGMIVGAIVSSVSLVLSYFFGSSASSRSKDQALIERQR